MAYREWAPYISVADRLAKADRKMTKLKKKGHTILPVKSAARLVIAKTFWGKAWCDHIEIFSDYENRLPRGRTYVRNGSVCHVAINKGSVEAFVAGYNVYAVSVQVKPLSPKKWQAIKSACSGKIGSLLELLSGQISSEIMASVSDVKTGLFPSPSEINFSCECPDYSKLCKHIAAVLYGVGARLDSQPEDLFKLRGVDCNELIELSSAVDQATDSSNSKRKRLDNTSLSDIFGVDIAASDTTETTPPPKFLTGTDLTTRRTTAKLSKAAVARAMGVSSTTVSTWEKKLDKKIKLSAQRLKVLLDILEV